MYDQGLSPGAHPHLVPPRGWGDEVSKGMQPYDILRFGLRNGSNAAGSGETPYFCLGLSDQMVSAGRGP